MAQESEGYGGYQGYGGYGAPMDPASMRAKLAMSMIQQGSDSSPIRSPWQGAARMSNALFGALMMRQMQDAQQGNNQVIQDQFNRARAGGFGLGGGAASGASAGGFPAQPGALSDLANDPAIMGGVANAATNGLPDSATIGQSLQMGAHPPQMGPPMSPMAPNNAAGGVPPGGPMPGGALPAGGMGLPPGPVGSPAGGSMVGALDPRMMVAGPGAPSPFSAPASGNGPQGAGAGFNPADLAMFQGDMQAVPGSAPQQGGAGGGILDQLKANIAKTESGGNYGAVGPDTGHGNVALGKYQVMASNVPSWTKEILGQEMTPQQFLASPQAQEAVANGKLGGYLQQYGPAGAARAWFTGSPVGKGADVNGMTGDRYAALATQGMGSGGGNFLQNSVAGPGAPSGGGNVFQQDMQAVPGGPSGPQGAPPGSMQPGMMVAGPGAPYRANANPNIGPRAIPQPPDVGGGGNPLSGLTNMFGLGNPSSPQGGNAPASAAGGTAGGGLPGVDPQVLMHVAMDPYSSPQARQMAGQLLQYYMPHPAEWRTNPGTNDQQAYNPLTGQPIQGMFRPGPHETSIQDIGTDLMGVKHQGIFDKNTGKLIQVLDPNSPNGVAPPGGQPPMMSGAAPGSQPPVTSGALPPGGQPSQTPGGIRITDNTGTGAVPNSIPPGNIPPPNPAWTPQRSSSPGIAGAVPTPANWTKGLDAQQAAIMQNPGQFSGTLAMVPRSQLPDVMSTARAIVEGRQQPYPVTGVGPTKWIEQATMDAVRSLDPAYTSTRYDSVKDFNGSTPGSTGGQLTQGRTGIGHLRQAMDLSQQLNQNQSGIGNMPIVGPIYNELVGNQKQKDVEAGYTEAVTKANSELTRFYLGAPGTEGEREEGLRNELSANANPDVRTKALKELAELANSKIQKLQERWHAGTGGNMPDYPILQPADQENFDYTQKFGRMADKNQGSQPTGGAQATQQQGGRQPNAAAVQMLKGNPGLADAFDQKYGPGSAARALGQ